MRLPLTVLLMVCGIAVPLVVSEFWTFIAIEVLVFALYASSFNLLLGYGGMLSLVTPHSSASAATRRLC